MENDPKIDDNLRLLRSPIARAASDAWSWVPVSPRQPRWHRFLPVGPRPAWVGWCKPPREPAPLRGEKTNKQKNTHTPLCEFMSITFKSNSKVNAEHIHPSFENTVCGFHVKCLDSKLTRPLYDKLVKWQIVQENKVSSLEHFNWLISVAFTCFFFPRTSSQTRGHMCFYQHNLLHDLMITSASYKPIAVTINLDDKTLVRWDISQKKGPHIWDMSPKREESRSQPLFEPKSKTKCM